MGLSEEQIIKIKNTLRTSLRNKFKDYKPETYSMPFHFALLGKDRVALYSFIHSLATNFGTTIFEPVAASLATTKFVEVKTHIHSGKKITEDCLFEIQKIMDSLSSGVEKPNKVNELQILRSACKSGTLREVKPTKVDIFLRNDKNEMFLIDLKTVKPNKGGFKEFKRTLLEWAGVILTEDPDANVHTLLSIPYNPYSPRPYARWTMAGMLDLKEELKVAEEFWDFLGGKDSYNNLLNCFEEVGIEMRDEIDLYFKNF
ncbi:MAG: TdeIII family type II restriction endonuclease [Ignavibacteriales bacterium]|nr:TdeIII family type II restriction endonuclease [Ignavibacteriota bacterium]MCO6449058.1 TdeIII family type II restriction endonuclease [Ignavibacterium album]MCZ2269651.1 TdeIII family type II restriction endonuclease [Ignavibacteriales bacterium]HOJ08547.1 TdeIII family type II restriction endonuclease [Ignavibacteriaceae bacterium]